MIFSQDYQLQGRKLQAVKNLTKKLFTVITVFMLLILFSSCINQDSHINYSDELKLKLDELEKLKEQNDTLNKQIEQLQNDNKTLKTQLDNLYCKWLADLTGDGINETITGPLAPAPIWLLKENGGSLKVESQDGNILLNEESEILSVVGLFNVGAKTPVLVTLQQGGGSMRNYYGAYIFDSVNNKLKSVQWDNSDIVIGILDESASKPESIVIWNRGLQDEGDYEPYYKRWVYKDNQMVPVEKWNADN